MGMGWGQAGSADLGPLCSVFIHLKPPPLHLCKVAKCSQVSSFRSLERGVVWNSLERALEELLGWEEDAILPL